ncbi:tyrosine-type recombinase/integrase [Vibrio sp. ER1A]|uniref:tyrosine-type recombinase/integrase n=1 Tax=Vibrio sp. ER1A TaxID=1517681 RepID=UPI0004DD2899|nr:site-specific integrase [Vibrio sp. ER1A]KFA99434.1 hypothetical protein HW45_03455 [Vibrio sp. ER1A]
MKLTEKFLKSKNNTTDGKPFKDFSDGGGMIARLYKSGSISFYYRHRWNSKPAIALIGKYPDITLKEARSIHNEMRIKLTKGQNPKHKIEKDGEYTIQEGFDCWYEKHVLPNRKHSNDAIGIFRHNLLEKHGSLVLNDITALKWIEILKNKKAPTISGRLLKECRAMCSYLIRLGLIKPNAISAIKIEDVGSLGKVRDRIYTRTELKAILDFCEGNATNIENRALLFMLMFWGCRVSEIGTSTWKRNLNFQDMQFIIMADNSKNSKKIVRPIPEFMMPMLNELKQITEKGGYLIPYEDPASPPGKLLSLRVTYMRRYTGIDDMIAHSFRHTMSTHLADLGIAPHVAEKLLGHSMAGVMAVYNKGDYLADQLVALNTYYEWIKGA